MESFSIRDAGHLSHAYILASPDREACLNLAGQIAAAAVCLREKDVPCGQCRACRKAMSGIHPDIIHIRRLTDSSGQPRRELTVDQIRAMTADAYVLPNEAARKVYIVDEADKMNPQAQNAALKTLEEPPPGVIFLLCAENPGLLLPTVRSRCVELSRNGEKSDEDEAAAKLAGEYLRLAAGGDAAELYRWCVKHDGLDRAGMSAFLDSLEAQVADMLCERAPSLGLDRARLWALQELADRCRSYGKQNVGMKHILGLLAVKGIA